MPEEQDPQIIDVEPKREGDDAAPLSKETSVVLARDLLPDTLLIVPAYERPLFPKMMGPVLIAGEELKRAVAEALKAEQKHLGVVLARANPEQLPGGPATAADFHEVGVAVRVVQASPPPAEGPLQLVGQVLQRFKIVEFVTEAPAFRARVEYWHESEFESNEELRAYSVAVVDSIKELVNLNPLYKEGLSLILDRLDVHDPGVLADFAAAMTTASGEELQEVLATRSVRKRIEQVLILLKREIEISKLKTQISKRIEERMSKQQREFFLKEQLKEIKHELGLSKEGAEAEVDRFQKRIGALTLTEEARERIDEEMEKLKLLDPSSPEFNVVRAYLDWLTVLPWGVHTEDSYDLKRAARILDEDHYGLTDVKDRILELISVGIVKGDLAGSIMLLVGPPGVGKTSVGRSIARALGREFYRFSLGGIRDEAEIKGHRRTYIGAMPGKFIQAIKTCKTANPLIMLDEVDKVGASFRGDPASALLEVLDPEQNRDFLDHYLDVRFDLSKVLFVCTGNQLETIPRPLLDRMEVIQVSGYILDEKLEIARRHLIGKQLREHGLRKDQVVHLEEGSAGDHRWLGPRGGSPEPGEQPQEDLPKGGQADRRGSSGLGEGAGRRSARSARQAPVHRGDGVRRASGGRGDGARLYRPRRSDPVHRGQPGSRFEAGLQADRPARRCDGGVLRDRLQLRAVDVQGRPRGQGVLLQPPDPSPRSGRRHSQGRSVCRDHHGLRSLLPGDRRGAGRQPGDDRRAHPERSGDADRRCQGEADRSPPREREDADPARGEPRRLRRPG